MKTRSLIIIEIIGILAVFTIPLVYNQEIKPVIEPMEKEDSPFV